MHISGKTGKNQAASILSSIPLTKYDSTIQQTRAAAGRPYYVQEVSITLQTLKEEHPDIVMSGDRQVKIYVYTSAFIVCFNC